MEKANPGAVAEEIVGLGVEGDFLDVVERIQKRGERRGLVDEGMDRRGVQSGCGQIEAEVCGSERALNRRKCGGRGAAAPAAHAHTKKPVDQLREFGAVAALQHCCDREIGLVQPAAQFGEVLGFQRHGDDRIPRIGIKAGGGDHEVGFEADNGVPRAREFRHVIGARRVRRDGIIAAVAGVARPGPRVGGKLVDGTEQKTLAAVENRLGAIAVMGVEIPHRHAMGAAGARGHRGEGDLVKVAETHRLAGRGVVSRRAHEGKGLFVLHEGEVHGRQRRAHRPAGMIVDALKIRSVVVEVRRALQAGEMGAGVHRQQYLLGRDRRDAPFPFRMRRAQERSAQGRAPRLLRAQRGAKVGALGIVQDDHGWEEPRPAGRTPPAADRSAA